VQEAAVAFSAALPAVETPLASAAEVAEATNASQVSFQRVMGPLVGPASAFRNAAIWQVGSNGAPRQIVSLGDRPRLEARGTAFVDKFLRGAAASPTLTVVGLFDSSDPRLALAARSLTGTQHYVTYAESALPKDRKSKVIAKDTAFAGLGYALYLGTTADTKNLIATDVTVPVRGRSAGATIAFGNNHLRIVMTPLSELGGSLLARLWWIVLVLGLLLTFGATALTERLVRRREQAQRLADENARLYAAQRSVAQTLQHSILPEVLPQVPGLALDARYIAGVADIDIGGDWYDVIDLCGARALFVVGDVSGSGLPAATVMASLRYAIRAYAIQGDDPAAILTKLAALIDIVVDEHFATVLCGVIDTDRHELTLANAGHPEPLLVGPDGARFLTAPIGVPIGVQGPNPYTAVTVSVPAGATLLAFTDGLIERRGEELDTGLARLRDIAVKPHASIDDLLSDLAAHLPPDGPADDIAILGVRWTK